MTDDLKARGVRVRKLEWEQRLLSVRSTEIGEVAQPDPLIRYRPVFLALGSGGTYREVWGCWVAPPMGGGVLVFRDGICEFPTLEAAKAAAQADYAARIMAALEISDE